MLGQKVKWYLINNGPSHSQGYIYCSKQSTGSDFKKNTAFFSPPLPSPPTGQPSRGGV